jgi:hypothetical protein
MDEFDNLSISRLCSKPDMWSITIPILDSTRGLPLHKGV